MQFGELERFLDGEDEDDDDEDEANYIDDDDLYHD